MKIVFLSRWLPYPADNGSKIRILNLLAQLTERHEVALLTFAEPRDLGNEAAVRELRQWCTEVQVLPYRAYRPRSARALSGLLHMQPRWLVDTFRPEMLAALGQQVRRGCDMLVASELEMAPYALAFPRVPAVLEDIELSGFEQAHAQAASLPRRWRVSLTRFKLSAYMRRMLPRFQACTVVSELERDTLRRMVPGYPHLYVVPNAVDINRYRGPFGPPQPGTLVYAGALTYFPNFDAVDYFLREVQPLVLREEPNVRLRVTGRTNGVDLKTLPSVSGVEYVGHVPDVRPLIAESWASVVPLRHGGGTRIKILEAMAVGTPVISTLKGAEGLAVIHGEHLLLANDAQSFAASVVDVLRSPSLRQQLSIAGKTLVAARYDATRIARQLCEIVEHVGEVRVN